jgi:NADH:ubiquinone oxidoreductase subunit 6 (subunit J)
MDSSTFSTLTDFFNFSSFSGASNLTHLLGAFRTGTCLLVLSVQNPIHSLLLLIRVFFLGTLLLFTLQREYFALLFLIVYVGAIVVLFLFVIRRLELKILNVTRRLRDILSYRHLLFGLLILQVLFLLSVDSFDLAPFFQGFSSDLSSVSYPALPVLTERNGYTDWSRRLHRTDTLRALGGLLYTEYSSTLIIAARLLFLARVGAIAVTLVLAPSEEVQTVDGSSISIAHSARKLQDPSQQARRHPALLRTFR